MAERKQKFERRQVLDSAVADLLSNMEEKQIEAQMPRREREKKARERIKIQSRREQRATYDLPPALRQRGDALEAVVDGELVVERVAPARLVVGHDRARRRAARDVLARAGRRVRARRRRVRAGRRRRAAGR